MEVIDEGYIEIVCMLIDRGVDVNQVYGYYILLMEVIDEGYMDIVKLLMEKGVDFNKSGNDGYMFLMEVEIGRAHV